MLKSITPPPHPPTPPHPFDLSGQVVGLVGGLGLSWQATFGVILTLYFYSHYFFASGEPSRHVFAHGVAR